MTVKELIEDLKKYDGDLECMTYDDCDEGGGLVTSVKIQDRDDKKNLLYFKADHPFDYEKTLKKAVAIISSGDVENQNSIEDLKEREYWDKIETAGDIPPEDIVSTGRFINGKIIWEN